MKIKELINLIETKSLNDLIGEFRAEKVLKDIKEKVAGYRLYEVVQLYKFGTDKYVLDHIYDYAKSHNKNSNKYDDVKFLGKKVFFKIDDNGKNEILCIELINNHSFYEGVKVKYKK